MKLSWSLGLVRRQLHAHQPPRGRPVDESARECSGQGDLSSSCVVSIWPTPVLARGRPKRRLFIHLLAPECHLDWTKRIFLVASKMMRRLEMRLLKAGSSCISASLWSWLEQDSWPEHLHTPVVCKSVDRLCVGRQYVAHLANFLLAIRDDLLAC